MQSGLLTGRLTTSGPSWAADDWRRESPEYMPPKIERNLDLVERLRPIAEGARRLGVGAGDRLGADPRPASPRRSSAPRRPDQVDGWVGGRRS